MYIEQTPTSENIPSIPSAESLGLEISRKDTLEFKYISEAADLLKTGAEILFNKGSLEDFKNLITEKFNHSKISHFQQIAFLKGIQDFNTGNETFKKQLEQNELRNIVTDIPETCVVSNDELAGVVIVRAPTEQDYADLLKAFELSESRITTNGITLQKKLKLPEFMQGRVILLSETATKKTLYHEYLHFLYSTFLENEFQANIGVRHQISPSEHSVEESITTLQEKVYDAEEQLESHEGLPGNNLFRTFNVLKDQLSKEQTFGKKLIEEEKKKSISTYSGPAYDAFLKGR